MTARFAPLLLAAAVALGACGSERSEAEALPAPEPAGTAAGPAETSAPATAAAAAIPARFLGIWDAETGTCESASAELMLRIARDGIGFYESHGTVTAVTARGDGTVAIDLAMEGEGDTWEMSMTLTLMGQGADERLVVPQEDNAGTLVPLRLKRCAA